MSRLFAAILVLIWLAGVALVFVAVGGGITWLMFIYILSYIKLGITFMKYFPQVRSLIVILFTTLESIIF